jgi:UDP-N-acetylglucosamine 2-epimerase (non-hydrolysing)
MKVTIVGGARPNFMKIAPIIHAIHRRRKEGSANIDYRLVHTGQHYDDKLSKIFFQQLEIPDPHVNLGAGSGTQAEQTAKIMIEFERDLMQNPTDLVIVVGDVTSTLACAIVAKKLNTKVAHVEAGIRSFDMTMPEEINRLVTDSITDYFFTTTTIADENLHKAGVSADRIFLVGNTMIDTLQANLSKAKRPTVLDEAMLQEKGYYVLTLHRPSNVDDLEKFTRLIKVIDESCGDKIIFPVHPRTKKNLTQMTHKVSQLIPTDPFSYHEFIYLLKGAKGVITDSGGVQEETTVLGVPCVTLRNNTERPETVHVGTNALIGDNDSNAIRTAIKTIASGSWKEGRIPEFWDGKTADRIVEIIKSLLL